MKDLRKEARVLLEDAAQADAMPAVIRVRVRKRFLTAMATGTVSFSAVLARSTLIGASSAGVGATSGTGASLTATWIGAAVIGLVGGLIAVTPTSTLQMNTDKPPLVSPTPQHAAASATRGHQVASAVPTSSNIREVEVPAVTIETGVERGAATANSRRQDAPLDSVPSRPTKASIARETELISGAQRALQKGQPDTALLALDQYSNEFSAGVLQEEAIATRIVALCALGRVIDGRRGVLEFLNRYPNSPLIARIRRACSYTDG